MLYSLLQFSSEEMTMNKQLLFAQLNLATNGKELLSILDVLTDGMGDSESSPDSAPTLDEIQF